MLLGGGGQFPPNTRYTTACIQNVLILITRRGYRGVRTPAPFRPKVTMKTMKTVDLWGPQVPRPPANMGWAAPPPFGNVRWWTLPPFEMFGSADYYGAGTLRESPSGWFPTSWRQPYLVLLRYTATATAHRCPLPRPHIPASFPLAVYRGFPRDAGPASRAGSPRPRRALL